MSIVKNKLGKLDPNTPNNGLVYTETIVKFAASHFAYKKVLTLIFIQAFQTIDLILVIDFSILGWELINKK